MPRKASVLAAAVLACCWVLPAAAQESVAKFYRGRTVTIVAGVPPGGPYDAYARLLARYFGKHLPGEPAVIVSNMPGAGSNVAAGYVARTARMDGTYIAAPISAQPLFPILETSSGLNYDPSGVNYLGSVASDGGFCMIRSDAPAITFDDMLKTPVIMGTSSPSAQSGMMSIMLNNLIGTKYKMVFGYDGTPEILIAMQKSEIQGTCGMGWSGLKSLYPHLLDDGKVKIVVQLSEKGLPDLNTMGVPLIVSYAHDERQRRVLEIVFSQQIFAHPYFVAAEVPADRVHALRRAFTETWRDPEVVNDAAKMNLDVQTTSGDEIQSVLQKIYASPPALLQSVKEVFRQH